MKAKSVVLSVVSTATVGVLLALAPEAFAQMTSIKLFNAVSATGSGPITDPSLAVSFGQKDLILACETIPVVATISSTSAGTGAFVVDNFLTVNGVDVCTAPGRFACGTLGNCAFSCFVNHTTSYAPVPPLDISGYLAEGNQLLRFNLMDWGSLRAASNIWLVTNCKMSARCSSNADCDVHNQCTTDTCDTSSGLCRHTPNTGASCDDGNACTTQGTCNSLGFCEGTPVVCQASDQCHDARHLRSDHRRVLEPDRARQHALQR
jgi:hypothetical protein